MGLNQERFLLSWPAVGPGPAPWVWGVPTGGHGALKRLEAAGPRTLWTPGHRIGTSLSRFLNRLGKEGMSVCPPSRSGPLPSSGIPHVIVCFHSNIPPVEKYLATALSTPIFPLDALLCKVCLVLSSQEDRATEQSTRPLSDGSIFVAAQMARPVE